MGESEWKQGLQWHGLDTPASIDHQEINIACQFEQNLAAGAARWCILRIIRHHGDRPESPLSFGDCFEYRCSLSANGKRKRAELNVATRVDFSTRPEESSADTEARVGGMRPTFGVYRCLDEFLILGAQSSSQ